MRINLTKEDTLLLKGAAIMAIIFHNFVSSQKLVHN